MKNIVAIIPARSGSKGIPQKNIINVASKPLIAWSIEQAINSSLVRKTFVSTDGSEIAAISKAYGAEIIYRPPELASDTATSEEALLHAITKIENEQYQIDKLDLIVFLQATSPIRENNDIDNAINTLIKNNADSLFSSMRIEDFFIWEKQTDGSFKSITYDYTNRKRRQDIMPRFLENGSIYIFKPEIIKKYHNRLGGKITTYEMPSWKSIQIDNKDDLELCEFYLKTKILKEYSNE